MITAIKESKRQKKHRNKKQQALLMTKKNLMENSKWHHIKNNTNQMTSIFPEKICELSLMRIIDE